MNKQKWSRREMLGASVGSMAGMLFAEPLRAATIAPSAVTHDLIEAARKEGKISYYAAIQLDVAERLGKLFEEKYPGIAVHVERSGAERIFQRIAQENDSGIHAVDVANSTDVSHYLDWKKKGWLAPYLPDDVVKHFPADQIDPEGLYATACAWFEAIGYNTNLVKSEDAPKSYADLLDPKWKGKIVKGHPSYSGAILTATFVLSRDLGWSYLEKLAQQKVMQVQSAGDPPKKVMLGERAVMADGNDYNLVVFKDQGKPVEVVYATEGSPLIIVPSGVFKSAPNPNAARLFQSFFFSREAQQMLVTEFAHRSFHDEVKPHVGQKPMSEVKMLKSDPAAVEAASEELKAHYAKVFKV
ncbi:extracellular solute-binding protein [Bradyrhizobium sp.]|uniref:extracellular solute-binding protein n=1 Tax=Bradyrhizobium sp. TaxID=376 RepID=UPI003C36F1B6